MGGGRAEPGFGGAESEGREEWRCRRGGRFGLDGWLREAAVELCSALERLEGVSVILKASRIVLLKTSRMTIAPSNRTTSRPFRSSISTRERLGS